MEGSSPGHCALLSCRRDTSSPGPGCAVRLVSSLPEAEDTRHQRKTNSGVPCMRLGTPGRQACPDPGRHWN